MTDTEPNTTCITVHIAGSTLANPGPGGWAYVYRTAEEGEELCRLSSSGGELRSTAPRLEMLAAIRAFQFLRDLPPGTSATIVSSSQFLCKGINEWLPAWKAKGWRKSDRKPVANGDLWMELDDLQSYGPVVWKWVREGAGGMLTEEAARLAAEAAMRLGQEIEVFERGEAA